MSLAFTLPLALVALIIEALIGYPAPVYAVVRHPVTWIGVLIGRLEATLNNPQWTDSRRELAGLLALGLLLGVVGACGVAITALAPKNLFGFALLAALASTLPAQRSLYEHVKKVAEALQGEGLAAGRREVSMIVGRDVAALDEAGVARAALESLAENFSDGIVAPCFWTAVLGLPGGLLYKAANTADSMIGHKNDRYRQFGWAAARFDDWVNLPASRLAALWLVLAAATCRGADWRAAVQSVRRDARNHRSPNAGWPEAALAGALGLKLGGPRLYGGEKVADVFMGDGRFVATAEDIFQALALYRRACALQMLALAALVLIARG